MPTNEITNSDDVIDSRDIIARIEELEPELTDSHGAVAAETPFAEWLEKTAANSEATLQDAAIEYRALTTLAEEAEGYAPDWLYGATLIRESYFTDYCKDLVEDIGDLPRGLPDYLVIDWTATARNLKVDYTEVDFDGQTYLVR